jgi:phage-related protein
MKRVPAIFFRTATGHEPVREWLKAMDAEDRRRIGEDIMTVEFGWPVGMPTCRAMGGGLHEVRTRLPGNRIARILFYIDRRERMVVLHGFIKKSRATPAADLALARANKQAHERSLM